MQDLVDHPATKRIAIAAVAIVLFAGIVGAATKSHISIGEGRLTAHGRAAVIGADGQRREVSGVVALRTGETVEAIEGAMTVELPDGSTIEGRPAYKTSGPTRVKIERPVELLGGDLLVVAKNGTEVLASGNRVQLDRGADGANAMRVSRSLAVDATAYHGNVSLDSAGQVRTIRALRTLDVSALGHPPMTPTALHIDTADSWDRRFLAEAIDLDNALKPYAAGYTRLGTANSASPEYYRTLLPNLANEPALTSELLTSTPHAPGDMIIGAAIAALSRRGGFVQRWQDIFAIRDQSDSWGLAALDQGVDGGPLLNEVQSALNTTPFAVALGRPRSIGPTPTTGATSTNGTSTTEPTGSGGPTTQPPPPPTSPTIPPPTIPPPTLPTPTVPTIPPPTTPTLPQVPQSGDPVVDGLVNSVNQLLGTAVGQPPTG